MWMDHDCSYRARCQHIILSGACVGWHNALPQFASERIHCWTVHFACRISIPSTVDIRKVFSACVIIALWGGQSWYPEKKKKIMSPIFLWSLCFDRTCIRTTNKQWLIADKITKHSMTWITMPHTLLFSCVQYNWFLIQTRHGLLRLLS